MCRRQMKKLNSDHRPFSFGRAIRASWPRPAAARQAREPDSPHGLSPRLLRVRCHFLWQSWPRALEPLVRRLWFSATSAAQSMLGVTGVAPPNSRAETNCSKQSNRNAASEQCWRERGVHSEQI
jgi:hypothetical protein